MEGVSWRGTMVTSGAVLRNHSWLVQGWLWDAGNPTWVSHLQDCTLASETQKFWYAPQPQIIPGVVLWHLLSFLKYYKAHQTRAKNWVIFPLLISKHRVLHYAAETIQIFWCKQMPSSHMKIKHSFCYLMISLTEFLLLSLLSLLLAGLCKSWSNH